MGRPCRSIHPAVPVLWRSAVPTGGLAAVPTADPIATASIATAPIATTAISSRSTGGSGRSRGSGRVVRCVMPSWACCSPTLVGTCTGTSTLVGTGTYSITLVGTGTYSITLVASGTCSITLVATRTSCM